MRKLLLSWMSRLPTVDKKRHRVTCFKGGFQLQRNPQDFLTKDEIRNYCCTSHTDEYFKQCFASRVSPLKKQKAVLSVWFLGL